MKSPIHLKANRSNCSHALKKLIPRGTVVHSFLFLTGEVECVLLQDNRFVVAHTNKYAVYEFWRCLMEDPNRVAEVVDFFSPLKESRIFHILQDNWTAYKDPFVRSGLFFLLNYHSSTGLISSGEFQEGGLAPLAIANLRNFAAENFHIQFDEEDDFLKDAATVGNEECLLIAAGNYHLNFLEKGTSIGLEETRVYHKQLQNFFNKTDKKCVLVYKNHRQLFNVYKNHNIIMVDQYGRPSQKKEKCAEVLIANFRID